jgi:tetratricopeptide (TPR) repeat protein
MLRMAVAVVSALMAVWHIPLLPGAEPNSKPETSRAIPEIRDAFEAVKAGDFGKAEKLAEKAFEAHREVLPPPPTILAQLLIQANQRDRIRRALEKAVTAYPDDPDAYVVMGNVALTEGRMTEAGFDYAKAKDLLPSVKNVRRRQALEMQVFSGLAAVAEFREQWVAAQKLLVELLKVMPPDDKTSRAQAIARLGRAMFMHGPEAEALEKLKEAYKLDPENSPAPEAAVAEFYDSYPDGANVARWMHLAIERHPRHVRTLLAVGGWALRSGRIDEARAHTAKALEIAPSSPEARALSKAVDQWSKGRPAPSEEERNRRIPEEIDRGMWFDMLQRQKEIQRWRPESEENWRLGEPRILQPKEEPNRGR